jgi:DNA-binding NarL/FixJ family response regulator
MPPRRLRIVIADDHLLIRQAVRMILEDQPDLEVVAEAGDGVEAVEAVASTRPDVVLLDRQMPRLDGLGAARAIAREFPSVTLIMLSADGEGDGVHEAERAGASGYLMKTLSAARLVEAVRGIAGQDVTIDLTDDPASI